jgi:hypothetical protein
LSVLAVTLYSKQNTLKWFVERCGGEIKRYLDRNIK